MDHSNKRIIIKNPTIIDGAGKQPYKATVLIHQEKIKLITDQDINETELDIVIDGEKLYLLPGMIDCHVHVMINRYNLMSHLNTPFSLNFYNAIDNMKALLYAGITSARDAGGADLGVKRAVEKGIVSGPRLKISISPLSITGGHLDAWMPSGMQLFLLNPPYPGNPSGICDGPNEVRKRIREILCCGADFIKTCSTGGVLSPTDHPEFTQFTVQELEVMVQEAAMRKGIKVMAHAQGLDGVKNAIKAGVHSIEHGIYLDNEAIDLMLEKEVFLVPTLLAVNSVIEGEHSDEIKDQAKKIRETHQNSIAKAHKAGVKIAMGTDSGIMQHGRNLEELQLMCDIGMSPGESIVSATSTAAQCLELELDVGTITEGKFADMILVKENPLKKIESLSNSNNIKLIIKEGSIIINNI